MPDRTSEQGHTQRPDTGSSLDTAAGYPGARYAGGSTSAGAPAVFSIGEWTPHEDLRRWEENPRDNDGAPVERVAASIVMFGFVAPIVVWTSKGRLVAGDTRLKAIRWLLGRDEERDEAGRVVAGPSFIPKGAPAAGLVPVRFHEFESEQEANLYALADNRLGELAKWNDAKASEIVARYSAEEVRVAAMEEFLPPSEDDEGPAPSSGGEGHAVTRTLGSWTVHQADVLEFLKTQPDNSFDALLCDPPYGLGTREPSAADLVAYLQGAALDTGGDFMGKKWSVPSVGVWREALRVLKPGAPVLAFAGTKTQDIVGIGMRAAGFVMRDTISWLYGQGMPKSLDISKALDKAAGATRPVVGKRKLTGTARIKGGQGGATAGRAGVMYETHETRDELDLTVPATDEAKQWDGYGTGLKPCWEPCILAMKALDGTFVENVSKWGVGGLAIDASRISYVDEDDKAAAAAAAAAAQRACRDQNDGRHAYGDFNDGAASLPGFFAKQDIGRWPANVAVDGAAAALVDAQSGDRPGMSGGGVHRADAEGGMFGAIDSAHTARGDSGGASRFFYVAKASRRERALGVAENKHPTVKPVSLARYLATLALPPARAGSQRRLLIPYSGSGSEVIGALLAGWDDVTGIENDGEHVQTARARIGFAVANPREFEVDEDEEAAGEAAAEGSEQ